MADELQQIVTIRNQTLSQLEQLSISPKPSYSIDGQQISWQEYLKSLQQTVEWCDEKIAGYQPFECRSQGIT